MEWSEINKIVLPIMLVGMLLIAVILGLLMKNKSDKARAIPLQIIAGIILVLEIIKQILSIIDGYSTWTIPLHYCSLFVFFFPFAQFGNEKIRSFMKPVAFICGLIMTVMFYIGPDSIIGESAKSVFTDFGEFHTFVFHHLVILYVMLTLSLSNYKPQKRDWKSLAIVMSIYCVVGITCANLLETNYCNFLVSNIPFMESLRLSVGQVLYDIIMFVIVAGGTTLIAYLFYLIYDLVVKKLEKRAEKQVDD